MSTQPITTPVSDTEAQLRAEIELLKVQNEALKKSKSREPKGTLLGDGLSIQVSEKGAVSVYGLSRWPITLYGNQFKALLKHAAGILAFIAANESKLSVKPVAEPKK